MKHNNIFKSIILTALGFILTGFPALLSAQNSRVELTPFGGYMLAGNIKFYQGKVKIDDNACYGGMLAIRTSNSTLVELTYLRLDSKADWKPYNEYSLEYPEINDAAIAQNYIQVGAVNEVILDNDQVRPYGTYSLGATWLHPKEGDSSDEWFFSVTAGLGLKYYINDRIGLRFQARLLLPLVFDGGGFYMGFGSGGATTGVGVTSYAPLVQGDFTGGLIIQLGE
jgi:hypothetical protein